MTVTHKGDVTEVVAHFPPVHNDEIIAYLMLKSLGEVVIPGITTAKFRPMRDGEDLSDLKAKEIRGEAILLGIGGGEFDEHPIDAHKNESGRKCCATMVAEKHGLTDSIYWKSVLKYTLARDTSNNGSLVLDLAPTVVKLQKYMGWDLDSVVKYAEFTVNAHMASQGAFTESIWEEIRWEDAIFNSQPWKIAVIDDNNNDARCKNAFWLDALIVVNRNSSGQVQILSRNALFRDSKEQKKNIGEEIDFRKSIYTAMRDITRLLREREMVSRKKLNPKKVLTNSDWKKLESLGSLSEDPTWYFQPGANNVLNGSSARRDVPATVLSLGEIIRIIQICLDGNRWNKKSCAENCTSSPENLCPWWNWGLLRCRRKRFNQQAEAEAETETETKAEAEAETLLLTGEEAEELAVKASKGKNQRKKK